MKALLYTDWSTIRKSFKNYIFSAVLICGIVTVTSVTADGMTALDAAQVVQGNVTSICALMFTFYVFFSLFGQDEHEGWESVRLSLPVTRGQVVICRYAVMAIVLASLIVAGALIGTVIAAITTKLVFGTMALTAPIELAVIGILAFSLSLIYLAVEMPLFFKMGFMKARLYFTLPFFACMLFVLEPVQRAAEALGVQVMGVAEAIGSPVPLMLGLVAIALLLYAFSARLSTRIYEKREF